MNNPYYEDEYEDYDDYENFCGRCGRWWENCYCEPDYDDYYESGAYYDDLPELPNNFTPGGIDDLPF